MKTTTENTILELHKIGNKETKQKIEKEFPSLFTTNKSILQQAIEYLGAEDEDVIMLNNLEHIGGMNHVLAYQKLVVITKFKNEKHIFDWSDGTPKYYPYFHMDNFRLNDVSNNCHYSSCSTRLCLKSRELVKELCKDKEVLALYEQYFKQ